MSRELLQRVNAMLTYGISDSIDELKKDIDAELSKPLPKPVGYTNVGELNQEGKLTGLCNPYKSPFWDIPLYTSAPEQKPLSDDEAENIFNECQSNYWLDLVRAIERKHGITDPEQSKPQSNAI